MADVKKRLPNNVPGSFFVDSTCINCDTCRQLAPASFVDADDASTVYRQPETRSERFKAYQALLACPVGSIGASSSDSTLLHEANGSFPLQMDGPVHYCGFNSAKSFGANSYFIRHPEGNWLIDSPRYLKRLLAWFEQAGGIRYIFLTHEDDVAETDRYARHFGATRIIHRADMSAQPEAEWVIDGEAPVQAGPDFLIIPTPGHTPGSMVLLHQERHLFTGDHMWWDREDRELRIPMALVSSREALMRSTEGLLAYSFEWVLPGHGERIELPLPRMEEELRRLLATRSGVPLRT